MSDQAQSLTLECTEEILIKTDQYGNRTFYCMLNGERVGVRIRHANDMIAYEYGYRSGLKHGLERSWDEDGRLTFESHWVQGKEHGVARQWCQGKLLGTYKMNHGTGVDLWWNCDGSLSEERHFFEGDLQGFERWWRDSGTVWAESHFRRNAEHGIFRRWNEQGRLRRGYPKYYIDGKQVSKRQYARTCASDLSLPPFREEDNRPERSLPGEYLRQQHAETDSIQEPEA